MSFGEFTLLKITTTREKCDHPDRMLRYLWQRTLCVVCGKDYYAVKCQECGQQFTKCRYGGCNNGKMVLVES